MIGNKAAAGIAVLAAHTEMTETDLDGDSPFSVAVWHLLVSIKEAGTILGVTDKEIRSTVADALEHEDEPRDKTRTKTTSNMKGALITSAIKAASTFEFKIACTAIMTITEARQTSRINAMKKFADATRLRDWNDNSQVGILSEFIGQLMAKNNAMATDFERYVAKRVADETN